VQKLKANACHYALTPSALEGDHAYRLAIDVVVYVVGTPRVDAWMGPVISPPSGLI
jgi:hypothetical protein